MIIRSEKAQGWGLTSMSSLARLLHIGRLSTFTPSMAPVLIAQLIGSLPSAGEAGSLEPAGVETLVVQTGRGRWPCPGSAVPSKPGLSCSDMLWKGDFRKALPGTRLYFRSPNPASVWPDSQPLVPLLTPNPGPLHPCLSFSLSFPGCSHFHSSLHVRACPKKPTFLSDQLARIPVWVL